MNDTVLTHDIPRASYSRWCFAVSRATINPTANPPAFDDPTRIVETIAPLTESNEVATRPTAQIIPVTNINLWGLLILSFIRPARGEKTTPVSRVRLPIRPAIRGDILK